MIVTIIVYTDSLPKVAADDFRHHCSMTLGYPLWVCRRDWQMLFLSEKEKVTLRIEIMLNKSILISETKCSGARE